MHHSITRFVVVLIGFALIAGCQLQADVVRSEQPCSDTERQYEGVIVEAACGECLFGLPGNGCDLAVRIDGKAYYVDGTGIDDHGDAHADDGFCNAIRRARVSGHVENDRFVVTSFELLPNTQPNIIFLLADDMGYADLGCFGSPVIESPNLDRLASQGVRLTECYAASPNCSPARTGMLTGRSPYRVGMYDFARYRPMHIPEEEITIAELLQDVGYQTMFAGKWHCSGDFYSGEQPYPGDQGFDHWLAHKSNFGRNPEGFLRNGERLPAQQGWMSEIVVNETMDWLDERDTDRPFFTCLWFSEPHVPVIAADEFQELYLNDESDEAARGLQFGGPQVARGGADWDKKHLYFGCVSMLDHHIGRLLDYLDENNLSENTIIVFTSDNGPEHRTNTAFGSPGHFRGAKGHMHDGGIHVPGIVRWPGQIESATESAEPVNGTDWLPALCAVAGAEVPNDRVIDGANVFASIVDGEEVERPRPMLWWLWHARGGAEVAMRSGDYKMLATMAPQRDPGSDSDARRPQGWTVMQFIKEAELDQFTMYNLTLDPSETTELSETEPKRFEEMKQQMIELHREIREEGPVYELGQ